MGGPKFLCLGSGTSAALARNFRELSLTSGLCRGPPCKVNGTKNTRGQNARLDLCLFPQRARSGPIAPHIAKYIIGRMSASKGVEPGKLLSLAPALSREAGTVQGLALPNPKVLIRVIRSPWRVEDVLCATPL